MGVKPYAIATSVSLIIAQRLARKLCDNCKEVKDIPREALEKEGFDAEDLDDGLTIFGPKGCKSCNEGYKGRLGIFQVMEVSEAMGRIIMEGGNAMQIADQAANEGVIDLRKAGLNKVRGWTDQPRGNQQGYDRIDHSRLTKENYDGRISGN